MNYMESLFKMQNDMYENLKDMYSFNKDNSKEDQEKIGMEDFFDMQKKFFDYWGGQTNPFNIYDNNMKTAYFNTDNFKNIARMQKEYFDKFNDFYKNYSVGDMKTFYDFNSYNEIFNKYKEFYLGYDFNQIFDYNIMETLDKMYDVNKFYLEMYEFWNKLNDNFSDTMNFDKEKFNEFIEANGNMSYNMLVELLPEQFKLYLEEPKKIFDKYLSNMTGFYKPWSSDFNKMKELYVEGILGNDIEKITSFFKLWKDNYDETFGKLINSPALGSNKNISEQQNKAFDRFIDMFTISSEFSSKLMFIQKVAFKKITEQYANLSKEGMEAKTFEEFYNFWSREMDKYLVDYFGSEEFSKILGELGKSVMEFRIENNKLMESYLSETPLVTKGELDSMIKNVYDLKKEVKNLKKEIEVLKSEKSDTKKTKEGKTTKDTNDKK